MSYCLKTYLLILQLSFYPSFIFCEEFPVWPTAFTTKGVLTIPYAEVQEPFAAYIDLTTGQTRIDYYDGLCRTFQLTHNGPYGHAFKIVPMTDEYVLNQINCFATNGTKDDPITTQNIVPDLSGFSRVQDDFVNGENVEKWQKREEIGSKTNKYTMWLKRVRSHLHPETEIAVPVKYQMKGYNTLTGSHYDHYYLSYDTFGLEAPQQSVFDEYSKFGTCHGYPGPGMASGDHVYVMNPMKEFIESHQAHVDKSFDNFKKRHNKKYKHEQDHEARKDIFRQNLRYIHSFNRQRKSFTMASNHMSDWTDHERKHLRGKLFSKGYNGGSPFSYSQAELEDAPEQIDWRLYGAVTPVKDQIACGSCWSFGTTGTLEGAYFLQTGHLVPLSQQALMDCSWGFGNNGCDGGEDSRSYKFIMKHGGIPSEEAYGPYLGQDGFCHFNQTDKIFKIKGYVNVTSGDPNALKVAIAKHGPVSVAIDASHKSLSFYSNGVYYEPNCNNTVYGLDHAVLAVGYGEINNKKYWLIKNSWSTFWGNDGYVLMSQKDNNCGVSTSATYVIPDTHKL